MQTPVTSWHCEWRSKNRSSYLNLIIFEETILLGVVNIFRKMIYEDFELYSFYMPSSSTLIIMLSITSSIKNGSDNFLLLLLLFIIAITIHFQKWSKTIKQFSKFDSAQLLPPLINHNASCDILWVTGWNKNKLETIISVQLVTSPFWTIMSMLQCGRVIVAGGQKAEAIQSTCLLSTSWYHTSW